MLLEVTTTTIIHQCNNCETISEIDITNTVSRFIEEHGEYENFHVQCECNTVEVYNMNLPLAEPSQYGVWDVQRDKVKQLMTQIREER